MGRSVATPIGGCDDALRHDHGQGIDAFSWKQRRKESARAIDDVRRPCARMFARALSWMKGIEDGDGRRDARQTHE